MCHHREHCPIAARTQATVVNFIIDHDTPHSVINNANKRDATGTPQHIVQYQSPPVAVLVKIDGEDRQLIPGYAPGVLPIEPISKSVTVHTASQRRKRLNIRQVPIILGDALTEHKTQSKTYDEGLVVGTWKGVTSFSWVYVVLSRVRALDKLWIAEPLDLGLLQRLVSKIPDEF